MTKLPEFDAPPVAELALDVQFKPIQELRGLRLAPLRDMWRQDLPRLDEQPPLIPIVEGDQGGPVRIQLITGPSVSRYWFQSNDGSDLVQLQPDRFVVNWRATTGGTYPRYKVIRARFERRLRQLTHFLADERLPGIEIVQAEISYANTVEILVDEPGRIDHLLRGWAGASDHHLGEPAETRLSLAFEVRDLGRAPVRLYVAVNPGQREDGTPVLLLNLTIRGRPVATGIDEALAFIDGGHEHIVMSFAELTSDTLHDRWGRRT